MRRINVYIDEELDMRAEREARRRQISKAALIRAGLAAEIGRDEPRPGATDELVGISDAEPVEDIDAIIYRA